MINIAKFLYLVQIKFITNRNLRFYETHLFNAFNAIRLARFCLQPKNNFRYRI